MELDLIGMMKTLNGVRPRKVRIYFYKDKIHYFFNKMMHCYTHTHTHTHSYCEMYLSFDEFNGSCFLNESSVEENLHEWSEVLTRHVHHEMPATMFWEYSEEISDSFTKNYLNIVYWWHFTINKSRTCSIFFRGSKWQEYVWKYLHILHIPEHFRQSIYMHQFYFNGIYSDWYNNYLLVMETILETRYKWQRIDENTHYCQIECYHVYLWRYKW